MTRDPVVLAAGGLSGPVSGGGTVCMLMRDWTAENILHFQCYSSSGMMSAMEEIQSRADNIMENIMMKEVELAEIEERAELAEEERLLLEHHSNQMLDEKQKIEDNIKYLVKEKETMEQHIETQEAQVLK